MGLDLELQVQLERELELDIWSVENILMIKSVPKIFRNTNNGLWGIFQEKTMLLVRISVLISVLLL